MTATSSPAMKGKRDREDAAFLVATSVAASEESSSLLVRVVVGEVMDPSGVRDRGRGDG